MERGTSLGHWSPRLYSQTRKKKNVIVKNEDVTYSSELAFLLCCGSRKAICNPKPPSIFPAQVISWLTHLQISLWIAFRISLRIIQMSNYGSQTPWLLSSSRMNFLNIWEKVLNFVQWGSKFISFGNKEPQRVFAQNWGLRWFYFVRQLQVRLTLGERFGNCEPAAFRTFCSLPWVSFGQKREQGKKEGKKRDSFSLCAGVLTDVISKHAALIAPLRSNKGRGGVSSVFSSLLKLHCRPSLDSRPANRAEASLTSKKAKQCLPGW